MVDYYINKILSKKNFKNIVINHKKKKYQILHFNFILTSEIYIYKIKNHWKIFHYRTFNNKKLSFLIFYFIVWQLDNNFKSIAKVFLMSYNIPKEVKEAIIFSNMIKKERKIFYILRIFINGRESKLEWNLISKFEATFSRVQFRSLTIKSSANSYIFKTTIHDT